MHVFNKTHRLFWICQELTERWFNVLRRENITGDGINHYFD